MWRLSRFVSPRNKSLFLSSSPTTSTSCAVVSEMHFEQWKNYGGYRSFSKKKSNLKRSSGNNGGGTPGDFVFHMMNLSKSLQNGRVLFNDVSLGILRGAKIGVLGANGTGKSSFIRVIAGLDKDFDGDIWVKEGVRIGYLPQEPELDSSKDVYGNILDGLSEAQSLLARFDEVAMAMGDPDADFEKLLEEQAEIQDKIDKLDCWNFNHEVERAMDALRVPLGNTDVTTLSGGERRRVALCRLLLQKPDMLLLDEPTNHLDAESVSWLEQFLQSYTGTVVSITHDRYFLDKVAGWILELENGHALPYEGNYTGWLASKHSRLDLEKSREKEKAKLLEKELNWIRNHQNISKSRQARLKTIEDQTKNNNDQPKLEQGAIVIPPGPRLGNNVIEVKGLKKTLGEKLLFHNLSFTLERGAVVGVIGANGSGKTSLFNIMSGNMMSDSGTVKIGETVKMGVVSQSRSNLNDKNTIYQEVSGGMEYITINGYNMNIRSYIAAFNLRGQVQEKLIGNLSGGERNRVQIAKELVLGNNVILLDEPTNDLDVDTLRSLEEALRTFAGTIVIISHDRYFLDRLCTHTIAFEGDSHVQFFEGGYSEYEEDKRKRLGDVIPKRIQFKSV